MNEEEIKKMLDIAGYQGYKLGAASVIKSLLDVCERDKSNGVTIESIKEIYEDIKKMP